MGFGRIDAPVVFVGMEEGPTSAGALDEDLAVRSRYTADVMDLKAAHVGIADADRYFDPERAPRQPTWRVMADLMLRREGCDAPTADDRRRYRATRLGRSDGDSLLVELLPYPHPKASDWLYERFDRYESRDEYMKAMLPRRQALLCKTLRGYPREFVVCYGKADWNQYEELFPDDVTWTDAKPFRVGEGPETYAVLTTHFSGRGFNTESQLAALARVALRRQ